MNLSSKIKDLRKQLELTQAEFANKINVAPRTVQDWESNKRNPKERSVKNMLKVFSVNPNWFYRDSTTIFLEHEIKFHFDEVLLKQIISSFITQSTTCEKYLSPENQANLIVHAYKKCITKKSFQKNLDSKIKELIELFELVSLKYKEEESAN